MKELIILFISISNILAINGQREIPLVALEDLSIRYSKVVKAQWQPDRFGFQARFIFEGEDQKVIYSKSGTWLETISNIPFSGLTENVRNFLKSRYQDYQIKEVKMIETKDFFGFEVDLQSENSEKVVLVSDNTQIVIEE